MAAKTMVKSKQQYEVMEQTFEMQSIRLENEMAKMRLEHTEAQEIAKVGTRRGGLQRAAGLAALCLAEPRRAPSPDARRPFSLARRWRAPARFRRRATPSTSGGRSATSSSPTTLR